MGTSLRFVLALAFLLPAMVFLSGCPCDCIGPSRICPDQFTDVSALTCTYSGGVCNGCESRLTLYIGTYKACRQENDSSKPCDDCDPPCYKQQCEKKTYFSNVDCSLYSYDANVCHSRNCKYGTGGGSGGGNMTNLQAWGGTVYVRPMLQTAA